MGGVREVETASAQHVAQRQSFASEGGERRLRDMAPTLREIILVLVSITLGVLFEDPIKRALRYALRTLRRWMRRVVPVPPPREPYCFTIGSHETDFVVLDGTGVEAYRPENLQCTFMPTPIEQPSEVLALRQAIEGREAEKDARGLRSMVNGPLYALRGFRRDRDADEHISLRLDLVPTDYFTFQATVFSLDVPIPGSNTTLRKTYLTGPVSTLADKPIGFMANAFGVIMVVVTSDDYLILNRRSDDVGGRRNELDATYAESMLPAADKTDAGLPDPYRTALRGLEEELGLVSEREDVHFLGFGLDVQYYQWSLIGLVKTDRTAREVLEGKSRGTTGNWESSDHIMLRAEPKEVFEFLRQELKVRPIWSTGFVAIYWTLVHLCGRSRVEAAGRWAWPCR